MTHTIDIGTQPIRQPVHELTITAPATENRKFKTRTLTLTGLDEVIALHGKLTSFLNERFPDGGRMKR